MNVKRLIPWKLFLVLFLASIAANIAVLPYAFSLDVVRVEELPVPLPVAVLIQIVQATIFFAVAVFFGLLLGRKVGLGAPFLESWITGEKTEIGFGPILKVAAILGIAAGVSIFVLDRFVFSIFVEPITAFQETPPIWTRLLASFYGGIGEEIFMRFFLMTLLVWITYKIKRTTYNTPIPAGVWLAIILISVVFGLGHLPMTARFTEITTIVVLRAIILNGIAGITFGWLYWKKGLEAAMISHFTTDIVLHVILPSLM
ncbi:CPBP family intramembrane glutamic endopeptidase [Planctomycetota bacterium]